MIITNGPPGLTTTLEGCGTSLDEVKKKNNTGTTSSGTLKHYNYTQQKDPNVMDVDIMSVEK